MHVLGITASRGPSAACLLRDGRVIAAAREDRFTGRTDDHSFPRESIAYCLRAGKIGPADVNVAAVAGEAHGLGEPGSARYLDSPPRAFSFRESLRGWLGRRSPSPIERELDPGVRLVEIEASLAHAAAAFHASPFEEATTLVLLPDRVELFRGSGRRLDRVGPGHDAEPGSDRGLWRELLVAVRDSTGTEALAVAGPLAGDRSRIGALEDSRVFDRVWVHPASPGGADAVGAAVRFWSEEGEESDPIRGAAGPLGPIYNSHLIRTFLRSQDVASEEVSRDDLAPCLASLLTEGLSIGWFQGRLELAQEPIGSRSVLRADSGDGLVAVTVEKCREAFEIRDGASPHFARATSRADASRGAGEAGSKRAITVVDRSAQRQLHEVLTAYEELARRPVLEVAPLRAPGEPVACTPGDAFRAYESLRLDALVMGPYLVRRERSARVSGRPLTEGAGSREID